MRAVGLAFLFLGALVFLYPLYKAWVRWISLNPGEHVWVGGLLVAVGALTLAVFRKRDG